MKRMLSIGITSLALVLSQGAFSVALAEPANTGAPAKTAETALPAQGKYLLIMTLGYLGGQPGAFLSKPGSAAVDAVMIKFNSMSQCEYVETQMKEKWRKDIFNSICIALPEGAEIIG